MGIYKTRLERTRAYTHMDQKSRHNVNALATQSGQSTGELVCFPCIKSCDSTSEVFQKLTDVQINFLCASCVHS